jgi:hypothetical protein
MNSQQFLFVPSEPSNESNYLAEKLKAQERFNQELKEEGTYKESHFSEITSLMPSAQPETTGEKDSQENNSVSQLEASERINQRLKEKGTYKPSRYSEVTSLLPTPQPNSTEENDKNSG